MKNANKIPQNSTISEDNPINPRTGLSPIQENAVVMLVSGKSITDVSKELKIDRGTLYNWFDKLTFQAYYFKQCAEIKSLIENKLYGLYNESLKAINDSLESPNEAIKLKAAIWLIEHIEAHKIGYTDPKQIIEQECNEDTLTFKDWGRTFNMEKYNKLCLQNGLNP